MGIEVITQAVGLSIFISEATEAFSSVIEIDLESRWMVISEWSPLYWIESGAVYFAWYLFVLYNW